MVKVIKTPIPGLLVVKLQVHHDSRGFFKENFNLRNFILAAEDKLTSDEDSRWLDVVRNFEVVQNNISFSDEGVIRGMHAEPWEKFISVGNGKVYGAWVDLREENFGTVFQTEIDSSTAIFVPRGVANGFQSVKDATYTYLVNDYWSKELKKEYKFVNLADPELKIKWPLGIDEKLLSDDDKNHPFLSDYI